MVEYKQDVKRSLLTPKASGENHLSFIETSALDASNVELAFQNILTGMWLSLQPNMSCVREVMGYLTTFDHYRDLPNRI